MRVLLAIPTINNDEYMGASRSLRFVENYTPSLGLGYLAACLLREGAVVKIYNPVVPEGVEKLAGIVKRWRPDALGLSAFTSHLRAIPRLMDLIGDMSARPYIVIGGPHASALPEETIRWCGADMAVVGEGEKTFVEVVRRLSDGGGPVTGVSGTVHRSGGEVVREAPGEYISDLDAIPFPARDVMPSIRDSRPTPASSRRLPQAAVMTSRGCPYKCAFCDRSVFGNKYRARGVDYVIAEVEEVVRKYGAREIRFYDDDFAIIPERAIEIAGRIESGGYGAVWTCHLSARAAEPELLKALKRAGCWLVLFGLESGSDAVLRSVAKHTERERSLAAVRMAHEAGLLVRADFIAGVPGETIADMRETFRLALEAGAEVAQFNKFVPYPGTKLYSLLSSEGHIFDFNDNWSDTDNSNLIYTPDGVDPDEFRRFLDSAHKRYYLRPGFIFRRLAKARTFTELSGLFKGALAMAFL